MKSGNSRHNPIIIILLILAFVNPAAAVPEYAFSKKSDTAPAQAKASPTDIEDIEIPEDIGLIKDTYKGDADKLIVHIQDAHCNFEAQTNISKIIELLMDKKGLVLVALEGSAGEIDTSLFTTFPDEEIRKEVATYFLKKGKICGAEHLAINTERPILLYGIENKDYYLENLEAFTSTLSSRPAAKKACAEIRAYLNKLKGYVYNKELKALDRKIDDYDQDKVRFVDFCNYLNELASSKKVDLKEYQNFSRLIKTLEIEKTINFKEVEGERSAIIAELEKKLSQNQLADLLKKSLLYKQKRITGGEYYTYLKGLAEDAKIKTSDFKNFNSYVNYIDSYTKIDNPSLFKELKGLQEEIKESLYTNPDQRTLNRLSKDINLITDLVDISLSKDEAAYLLENSHRLNSGEFTAFIQRQASKYGLNYSANPGAAVIDEVLPTLEKFYQVANKREDALLENTINKMDEKGYGISVLISGGYHTEGLTQRFKERGISYLVVAPRITDLKAETPYLEILSGGKITSEEAVLEGEGTLSPTSLNAKNPSAEPGIVKEFTEEACLLFLSGHIYRLKQENPYISSEELKTRLDIAREQWKAQHTGPQKKYADSAIDTIVFDLDALRMDARGRIYIPLTLKREQVTERKVIRYYNLAMKPAEEGLAIERKDEGEMENVGLQILDEGQFEIAMQKAVEPQAELPVIEETPPAEEMQAFTQRYLAWEKGVGRSITLAERIEKLAEIFVRSMHGLRGSPDAWLIGMVEALNSAVADTARQEQQRLNRRLAEACGPQALFYAMYYPEKAGPLFRERYSSPSHISNDLSALFLTAIDMSELGGRVAHIDDEARLYHTGFALAQLGELIGVRFETDADGRPNINAIGPLNILTKGGQRFIAHIRREAHDPEGNHYVEVETVTDSWVTYRDNGVEQTVSKEDFMQRWTGDILVDARIKERLEDLRQPMENQGVRYRLLDPNDAKGAQELKGIKGACGIITTVGAGFGKHLGAMRQMEYRGRDNEGWGINDEFGTRVTKVKGYSEGMARAIYNEGQGLEERAMYYLYEGIEAVEQQYEDGQLDGQLREALLKLYEHEPLTEQDRRALHTKYINLTEAERPLIIKRADEARRALRARQKITSTSHSTFSAPEMYAFELDGKGHVKKDKAVGVGQMGFIPSGPEVDIFGGREYQIKDNIPALVKTLKNKHELDIEYIKYFVRFELEKAIAAAEEAKGQHPEHIEAKIEELTRAYDRVIDRIIREEEVPAGDEKRWEEIRKFLNGRYVRVPGLFSLDPVRNLFRLQASLIGTFKARVEDRGEVEKTYREILKAHGVENWEKRDWFADWREEARLNIVGRASEALTKWFQENSVIPEDPSQPKTAIINKYDIELGAVDSITLGYMYKVDFLGGHDRWATTGSDEKKDGQPHTDTGVLSGLSSSALAAIQTDLPTTRDGKPLSAGERLREIIERAKKIPLKDRGRPTRIIAHNGDLNPNTVSAIVEFLEAQGYDFMTEEGERILTDTKALIVFWEYVRNAAYLDSKEEGKMGEETNKYINTAESADNFLKGTVEIAGEKMTLAALWNEIVNVSRGAKPEEVALRLALTVFGQGSSEIAADTRSLHMPDKHIIVSHDRPLYVVVKDEIRDGRKVDVKYQVTSDPSSALQLWDTRDIDADVLELNKIDEGGMAEVDKAEEALEKQLAELQAQEGELGPAKYQQEVAEAMDAFSARVREIDRNVEAKKDKIRKKYKARIITLRGEEKVVSISKRINMENDEWEVGFEYTDFLGNPIDAAATDEIKDEEDLIPIDIADKGKFRTDAENHINEIPWICQKSVANYVAPDGTVDMGMVREDVIPTVMQEIEERMDEANIAVVEGKVLAQNITQAREIVDAVFKKYNVEIEEGPEGVIGSDGTVNVAVLAGVEKWRIARYGIDIQKLKKRFGENLKGLKRIFITGIGSSERDAKCIQRLFKELLPDVEIIPVGPGHLVSTNQHYDEKHDLVVGISWSGSTALTLDALMQAKDSHGVIVASLTGKPKSDIGTLTADSGGTVHVRTGEERAVFTTKGFLGILFDLGILGVQLSQLRDGILTEEKRQEVQAERKAIVEEQQKIPKILKRQGRDQRLDPEDPDSWVSQEGKRYRHGSGAIVIGSKHNNPIIEEGELKWEETRWILGKAYDYAEDTVWNILEFVAASGLRWPIVIQATDASRFDEALALIQRCQELGLDFIVQTFEEDAFEGDEKREFWEKLQGLKEKAGIDPEEEGGDNRDRIQVYGVERVHPALQGVVDATFFFKSAVAFARQAGLSDLEINSSRNLAKSVTVKGIEVPGVLYEMFQYMSKVQGLPIEELVESHRKQIANYWSALAGSVDKAIARLPLVYDEVTRRCLPMTAYGRPDLSRFNFERVRELEVDKIKKVVVITEEVTDGNTAALMAANPLEHADFRTTGAALFERPKDPATGKPMDAKSVGKVAVNGRYFTVTYNFAATALRPAHTFTIRRDEDGKEVVLGGQAKDVTKVVKGKKKTIEFATVDLSQITASFRAELRELFGRDYKISANETQGLVFEAEKPALAGVKVVVHNPRDYDLESDIDENTMVVVLRRSNNRPWGKNAEVPDIEDPVRGRSEAQAAAPEDAFGEDRILEVLQQKVPEGTPIFAIADERSQGVLKRGNDSFGSIALPNDLDATSTIGAYYMSLLTLGCYLGWEQGMDMKEYETGLASARELSRQVVANEGQIERLRTFLRELRKNRFDMQYRTVQIIGGIQDYASALAWGTMLHRIAGVEAEALPVDESVHGPLAAVWNTVTKFLDSINKQGVNPDFSPHPTEAPASKEQDTLVVVLGTDSGTLNAAIVDANRNATRAARMVVVVKESDTQEGAEARPAVDSLRSRGAFILTIPDSPNELTNFSQMTLATIFANELNRSTSPEFSFARVTAGTPVVEAAVAVPPDQKEALLKELHIVEETAYYYRTENGGMIAKDVDLRNIDKTAFIGSGSIVQGPKTVIGANAVIAENSFVHNSTIEEAAQIDRSYLDDVDVKKDARVSDSILETVEEKKSWRFGDSEYGVANDRTVVEEGAKVTGQSKLVNTKVGRLSEVDDAEISNSEIGRKCHIKAAKVELTHTEDLVDIIGPTEVAEAWIGFGWELRNMAFVVGIFPNKVLALDLTDAGEIVSEFIEGVPNVSSIGPYAIFSDYQGEMKVAQNEYVTRITGEDETSEHGIPFVKSGVIAPETRLIALAKQAVDLTNWEHALEENLTVINPFAVAAHPGGGAPGREAWGQTLPGEARHGLSPRQTTPVWTFTYSPDTIIKIMNRMVDKLRAKAELDGEDPKEAVKVLDDFPEKMLKTGIAVCTRAIPELEASISQEQDDDKKQKLEERLAKLKQALVLYREHLNSGAWAYRNGAFDTPFEWNGLLSMFGNSKFDALLAKLIGSGLIQDGEKYSQTMMTDILNLRRTGVERETARTDITRPEDLKNRTKKAFIGPEVEIHPTARILPGTVLTGKCKIGANAVVWGSHLDNVEVGENTEVKNCIAENVTLGKDGKFYNSRLSASKFGDNVTSNRALVERSTVQDGTELKPRAVVIGCRSVAGVIGGPFIDSNVDTGPTKGATGVVDQHIATVVRHTDFPTIEAMINGEVVYFPNVANIGGGSTVSRARAKERVIIESAFIASDTDIVAGARIGFCAYVKDRVFGNEDVLPFTFKRGGGPRNDEIGGVLDMPGVIFRHLISKTKLAMPPEQRHLVDELVEAKMRETHKICEDMLAAIPAGQDSIADIPWTRGQLERGIARFRTNLDERRWVAVNHEFTEGGHRRISPEGAGKVEYDWEPGIPGTGAPSAPLAPAPGSREMVELAGSELIKRGKVAFTRSEYQDMTDELSTGLPKDRKGGHVMARETARTDLNRYARRVGKRGTAHLFTLPKWDNLNWNKGMVEALHNQSEAIQEQAKERTEGELLYVAIPRDLIPGIESGDEALGEFRRQLDRWMRKKTNCQIMYDYTSAQLEDMIAQGEIAVSGRRRVRITSDNFLAYLDSNRVESLAKEPEKIEPLTQNARILPLRKLAPQQLAQLEGLANMGLAFLSMRADQDNTAQLNNLRGLWNGMIGIDFDVAEIGELIPLMFNNPREFILALIKKMLLQMPVEQQFDSEQLEDFYQHAAVFLKSA